MSVDQIVDLVARRWLEQGGRHVVPRFNGQSRAGDPQYLVADCSRLATCSVSVTRPIESGVGKYVEWFRSLPEDSS
jgi:nucleoside-diphosphate-sugar epimerase